MHFIVLFHRKSFQVEFFSTRFWFEMPIRRFIDQCEMFHLEEGRLKFLLALIAKKVSVTLQSLSSETLENCQEMECENVR